MRLSCLQCVLKHVAQASILVDESKLGYPWHFWLALGHLAEAESESVERYPELAEEIREIRLGMTPDGPGFDVRGLINSVLTRIPDEQQISKL